MTEKGTNTPFIEKYEKALEKNAHSRVFAPLAECYRKVGMVDHALDILRKGLRHHPDYVLGLLSLAYCHIDNKNEEQAYDILHPLILSNRDNIKLQKTFGSVALSVGEPEEALDTYKYLLFMNPRDKEAAEQVEKLEQDIYRKYHSIDKQGNSTNIEAHFDLEGLDQNTQTKDLYDEDDYNDWCKVDLAEKVDTQSNEEDSNENWEMQNANLAIVPSEEIVEGPEEELDRDFSIKLTKQSLVQMHEIDDDAKAKADSDQSAPFVTHTLVDLYCSQGHFEKAIDLLRQIIALNPQDKKSVEKLNEVLSVTGIDLPADDEGHGKLMNDLDKVLHSSKIDDIIGNEETLDSDYNKNKYLEVSTKKLDLFYKLICTRAHKYQ